MKVNMLWAAVMGWAASTGAKDIGSTPGLWESRVEQIGNVGPFDIKINPHKNEIDGIPPFGVFIGNKDYFPGLIALLGPSGGAVMHSRDEGENENGLIEFFNAAALTAARHGKTEGG